MVEILAEAGITHGGDLTTAIRLADHALEAGADACKFQTYRVGTLFKQGDIRAPELEKLALPFPDFVKLAKHCEEIGIEFMSTPGDVDSLRFLIEECGVKRIKIGSDDLTNKSLVGAAYDSGKPVIISTGMATMAEIEEAMPDKIIDLTLLHCVSLYPCPVEKANIRAIEALKWFGYPVGYSDHTTENWVPAMLAVTLGAKIIEKHFCPTDYKGVDHEVSLSPFELRYFVKRMKTIEEILGSGIKAPCAEELKVVNQWRKGPDGFRGDVTDF